MSSRYKDLARRRAYIQKWNADNAAKNRAYKKRYRDKNKASLAEKHAAWKKLHPAAVAAQQRRHRERSRDATHAARRAARIANRNPEECQRQIRRFLLREAERLNPELASRAKRSRMASWRKRNAAAIRAYAKRRRETNAQELMRSRLSSRIVRVLRSRGLKKSASTEALLGTSLASFAAHIESQFLPGMTWANRHLWHVDHIFPCAMFDLTDQVQQKACFNFSNLRPLWSGLNQSKSDRLPCGRTVRSLRRDNAPLSTL